MIHKFLYIYVTFKTSLLDKNAFKQKETQMSWMYCKLIAVKWTGTAQCQTTSGVYIHVGIYWTQLKLTNI